MDVESLANWNKAAMEIWESFAPIRELIKEHPELKEPIIEVVGKFATKCFGSNFQGPKGELWENT
jgi:hypothetical protein